jgi:hypothetical protein
MTDRTEACTPEERIVRDANELARAGDNLAIAAARVCAEYDGVHRLRAALSAWYQVRAIGGGRKTRD